MNGGVPNEKTHPAAITLLIILALCGCESTATFPIITQAPTPSPAPTPIMTPAPMPAPAATGESWPADFSLKDAYKDYFLLGTIYTPASLAGEDKALTLKQFNVITPENILKPEDVQPTEGNFTFGDTDAMMQFARDNGIQVAGHTLAWYQQTPAWMGLGGRDKAIAQLKNHIETVVGRYKGQMLSWDVVNEAVADDMALPADGDWTKCLRNTRWLASIGPDYIKMAFEFAHEADPTAKLYYNDYNLDVKSKADVVAAMVGDLRSQGVPIDGIGMQGHYNTDTSAKSVQYSLDLFKKLGVEASITELDVSVANAAATGLTQKQEIQQAVVYAQLFDLFKQYKGFIRRVTFWGYVDNKSWRSEYFPCLFNADFSPKQAAYAVLDPEKYLDLHKDMLPAGPNMATAKYGTPVIDGEIDGIWADCPVSQVDIPNMAWEGAKGTVRLLWDDSFVYVLFEVQDPVLNNSSLNAYEQDSVEVFLDQKGDGGTSYGADDGQYRVSYTGRETFGAVPNAQGFKSAAKVTDGGYLVELAIPLVVKPADGMVMGFDAQVNDSDANGTRQSIMKFNDPTNNSYLSPEKWGRLKLVK